MCSILAYFFLHALLKITSEGIPCFLSKNRMGFHDALGFYSFTQQHDIQSMNLVPTDPERTWIYKKLKKVEDEPLLYMVLS